MFPSISAEWECCRSLMLFHISRGADLNWKVCHFGTFSPHWLQKFKCELCERNSLFLFLLLLLLSLQRRLRRLLRHRRRNTSAGTNRKCLLCASFQRHWCRPGKTNREPCLFVFAYVVYTGLTQYCIMPSLQITPVWNVIRRVRAPVIKGPADWEWLRGRCFTSLSTVKWCSGSPRCKSATVVVPATSKGTKKKKWTVFPDSCCRIFHRIQVQAKLKHVFVLWCSSGALIRRERKF